MPARELQPAGLSCARQVDLPVLYEDVNIASGHRADMIVEGEALLELKSVEQILAVHEAQTLTYLRLSDCEVALLLNFGTLLLKDGIRRFVS